MEALFAVESPALERLLARMVGPGADVEDLLQTTLMAAIDAFPRFRAEASVRTWLARIAVHTAQNYLRKPERRRNVPLELVRSHGEPLDTAPGPERSAESHRRLNRLYEHVDALRPKRRVALVLHVMEGLSVEEVAALMGATATATKTRLFLARRALAARLRRDPELCDALAELRGREEGRT